MGSKIDLNNLFHIYHHSKLKRLDKINVRNRLLRLLRYRASKGDDESQYLLGLLYADDSYNDIGIKTNLKRALHWYTLSCENNNPYACHNLAYFYEKGIVVSKNETKEIALYEKAFKLGMSESGYALYMLHKQRGRIREAIKWIKKTVKLDPDNGDALAEYAKLYFEEKIERTDFKMAYDLATKAIATKNITQFTYEEMLFLIGKMYLQGIHLTKDLSLGKYLITLANKDNDHADISTFMLDNKKFFDKIETKKQVELPAYLDAEYKSIQPN